MSRRKPTAAPAPAVASTGCSSLMSCLSRHRRGPPAPAPAPRGSGSLPRSSDADGAADPAERYWKRVQVLEEEIRRLNLWLGQDEKLAPAPATECVVRNGARAREESSRAPTATATVTSTNRCVISAGQAAIVGVEEIVRLEDGSYLHEVRRVGGLWERLAVQVSRPVVPLHTASASEVSGPVSLCELRMICCPLFWSQQLRRRRRRQVLDKMAGMRAEDLCKFLTQMMPLEDITGQQNPGEPVRRPARLSSGDDLVEALVVRAMDKLESLVLEGLKIQMASPAAEPAADRRRDDAAVGKDCMVHMVLMQARDPKERYGAIGDTMIGLIEASLQRKNGVVKLKIAGLHVAGISFICREPSDGACRMWSASLRQREGSHGGDGDGEGEAPDNGCRCTCVRNANRVFRP